MDPCLPCQDTCRSVFDRVAVNHLTRGGTVVQWTLLPEFTDPGPLEFQLQTGTQPSNDADDWEDVGLPVADQYLAVDEEQRVWGKTRFTHYRVVLTSSLGIYTSQPTAGLGTLSRRDWRLAREIVRQRRKAYRLGHAGQRGYLFKRRWTGQKCPVCLDHQTQEVRDPYCETCYGTGFKCGYYYPIECVWAETNPKAFRTMLDETRGTVNDLAVKGEMLMVHMMEEDDLWVNAITDDRWFVHGVEHTGEVRGLGIVGLVTLRLAPFDHIVYDLQVPQKLAELDP